MAVDTLRTDPTPYATIVDVRGRAASSRGSAYQIALIGSTRSLSIDAFGAGLLRVLDTTNHIGRLQPCLNVVGEEEADYRATGLPASRTPHRRDHAATVAGPEDMTALEVPTMP